MALWTPYAEQALDLSGAVNKERTSLDLSGAVNRQRTSLDLSRAVKKERASPEPEYVYPQQTISPHDRLPIPYYMGYHEAPCVPSAQISPDSVGSAWSPKGYRKSLSPPESPGGYDAESLSDDVEYQAFERDALRAMAEKNGGTLLGNNPRMRRAVQTSQAADDSYRKQRERNNYAAKQSRDRRKLREVRLAFQVTFLKKKLADLRARLDERVCARCQQQCRC